MLSVNSVVSVIVSDGSIQSEYVDALEQDASDSLWRNRFVIAVDTNLLVLS